MLRPYKSQELAFNIFKVEIKNIELEQPINQKNKEVITVIFMRLIFLID